MANSAFSDAAHAANRHSDIAITSVASNDILKFDGTNWVNSTTSPDSSIAVTQSSHGFAVGEALKSSGSNGAYAKAQADSAANAEVVGIVTVVTDSNNFTLTLNGMIRIAGAVPNETAGTALFLSAGTAGALTATEPSTSGQISKPVAIVTTANTEMILVVYRGETISTGVTNWDVNGLELVLDADGDTTLHASTDDQIDVKISGADDFRFTANNFNILSGSTITVDSGATITNSGTSTGFGDAHTVASHSDTTATGAELETLTDGSTTSLHAHAAGGTVDNSVRVTMSGAQSCANATAVTVLFGAETYDTDAFHNTGSNTGRLTCPSVALAGKYIVCLSLRFAGNTTGERIAYINHSADGVLAKLAVDATSNVNQETELAFSTIADLANGEYVTAIINQNSGGALNIETANTNFCMIRIA